MKNIQTLVLVAIAAFTAVTAKAQTANIDDARFVTYTVDTKKQDLQLYWKDDKGNNLGSIQNLQSWLQKNNRKLVFAMNGGMYQENLLPVGLFIDNQKTISPLNTRTASGNFYLKPNGVFYITTDGVPAVCATAKFHNNGHIKYATQSGPMLVIDGKIHPEFAKGSANTNIRNGVGILPNNQVVFVMSKKEINLYDFAEYFKTLGCKNALYLDGFVSRTYLPEKNWIQTDGNFGVLIGVSIAAK